METNIYNITILIACLLATVLLFFIISIIRYHRKYVKLQKERIHAEITIQENERKRIATDLHDSLGPLLSSVKLQINSLDSTSENDQHIINKQYGILAIQGPGLIGFPVGPVKRKHFCNRLKPGKPFIVGRNIVQP